MKKLSIITAFLLFVIITNVKAQVQLPIVNYQEVGVFQTNFDYIQYENSYNSTTRNFNVSAHVLGQYPYKIVLIHIQMDFYDWQNNRIGGENRTLQSSVSIPSNTWYSTSDLDDGPPYNGGPIILSNDVTKVVYTCHSYLTEDTSWSRLAQYTVNVY